MSDQSLEFDPTQQRWFRYVWILSTRTWKSEWMPPGWIPTPVQPSTPIHDNRRGSNASLLPAFSPLTYNPGANASPAAAGPAYGHSTGILLPPYHGSHAVLPRGRGDKILGTYTGSHSGGLHYELVDSSFYVRTKAFFTEGKVFAMIMNETAGEPTRPRRPTDYNSAWSDQRNINSNITPVKYKDNLVYTQTRRFIVVRQKREFCFACPVFTYSGRATLKPGVKPEEHGIAYSWGQEPRLIEGESGITKHSVGVVMVSGEAPLHLASRIYFGIHHPIQYNVKVKEIGCVHKDHIHALIGNWNEENGKPEVADNDQPDSDDDADITDGHSHSNVHNAYGYHPDSNPYMLHPSHNPRGYHPKKSPYSYHPVYNASGYNSDTNPYSYHPYFSPHGFHAKDNSRGYHPTHAPYAYHPHANPFGYNSKTHPYGHHPIKNAYAYHPQYNRRGYHAEHNPNAYHPTLQPQGRYVSQEEDSDQGVDYQNDQDDDNNDDEDKDDDEDEDDDLYTAA